jgi:hypothetical protein
LKSEIRSLTKDKGENYKMKKMLLALALCFVIVSLKATPAYAGSQPGMGSQKILLNGGYNGFVVVNLQYPDPTRGIDYYSYRVNVSLKNLDPNVSCTVFTRFYGGVTDYREFHYPIASPKGNAGTSSEYIFDRVPLPYPCIYAAWVTVWAGDISLDAGNIYLAFK